MDKNKKIKAVPFLKFLKNSSKITKNPLDYHRQFFETYGDTFTILNLKNKVVLSREVMVAQHILKNNHRNYHKSPYQSKNLSEYIGNGLLTANGEYWLKQRRLIQPAFHRKRLESLLTIIEKTVDVHIDKLPQDKVVALFPLMSMLAFDVVASSLFQFSMEKTAMHRLRAIIAEIQVFIVTEIRQPHKKWWFKLNGSKRANMQLVIESRGIIQSLIDFRRISDDQHDDLLQMLLEVTYEDGSHMPDEVLIDEIMILFVAGHETTANALTFTLDLLAKHPLVLNKVRTEANTVFEEHKELMDRIGNYKYIRSCIEESMRLFPPAWITDRVALSDDQIGPYTIKKGTTIGVSFYEIHRNPKLWERSEDFYPERFLEENRKDSASFYFPFGAGPRFCIGNNFALYEMMMVVAQITKRFDLISASEKVTLRPLITLKPEGIKMKFVPRKQKH